ncbi:MAG TPA: hypothetical protein VGR28_09105 [Candidatus Thermoplasmatota archaeon]|jgi:hypothetical protein|nr:hypothetical protein [Candidatus Thermoplasmatota archaeon]
MDRTARVDCVGGVPVAFNGTFQIPAGKQLVVTDILSIDGTASAHVRASQFHFIAAPAVSSAFGVTSTVISLRTPVEFHAGETITFSASGGCGAFAETALSGFYEPDGGV